VGTHPNRLATGTGEDVSVFNLENDARVLAERAISAADNAAQVVACLWEMLPADVQDMHLTGQLSNLPPQLGALLTPF
jgi:hypothetical protein